jgi:hypothetical protein
MTASEGGQDTNNGPPVIDDRVEALRKQMSNYKVQAYIIPTEDPHMVCCCSHYSGLLLVYCFKRIQTFFCRTESPIP